MKIQTTTNLDQFQFDPRNRLVIQSFVKLLVESLKEHGQLMPIIVNKDMVVADGQHRLEALRALNQTADIPVEVKYIKRDIPFHIVPEMNANQRQWRIQDWIHYYAESGNEDYANLQAYAEAYKPLKLSALASFLHENNAASSHTIVIRNGEFKFELTDEKKYILDKMLALSKIRDMFCQKSVLIGIMWLQRDSNFDAQRLFYALERNFESILQQSGTGNWARHMLYWYNKGLRSAKLNVNDLPRHH
tara:strand:- start:717 stop:1457 length:741 start_codon:yes stop_codon:yes gene_type:complete